MEKPNVSLTWRYPRAGILNHDVVCEYCNLVMERIDGLLRCINMDCEYHRSPLNEREIRKAFAEQIGKSVDEISHEH